jgi:hypothetical protein
MTPLLETIISLVFIFLVFSLITSSIVEFFAARVQKRGKMLRQFVIDSLEDRFNKNWGLLIYSHPLIEVLHHDIRMPKGFAGLMYGSKLDVKRRLPAYIPSEQFATALIDIIINHNRIAKFRQNQVTKKYELEKEIVTDKTFKDFLDGVDDINESTVKITLTALARKVNGNDTSALQNLKTNIAEWYDNGMDRLNGWYKKRIRQWLFMVGLIVAICFNVNTITVVNRLYSDPQLRSAVAGAAEKYIAETKQLPTSPTENIDILTKKIDSLTGRLESFNLPIGWHKTSLTVQNIFSKKTWGFIKEEFSLFNLLGWLMTALALSYGAPFWFDALKKAVNMRSAGIKPVPTNVS